MRQEHRAGELAYWDTFAGLVPCKVLAIVQDGKTLTLNARIRLTADRGPYKRGEITLVRASHVAPRSSIRKRKHGTRIVEDYMWVQGD